jgi:glycerol uptake facilitator-like aquaporin
MQMSFSLFQHTAQIYLYWSVFINETVLVAVLVGGLAAEKKYKNKIENWEEIEVFTI